MQNDGKLKTKLVCLVTALVVRRSGLVVVSLVTTGGWCKIITVINI
jgi:hypothetical protein